MIVHACIAQEHENTQVRMTLMPHILPAYTQGPRLLAHRCSCRELYLPPCLIDAALFHWLLYCCQGLLLPNVYISSAFRFQAYMLDSRIVHYSPPHPRYLETVNAHMLIEQWSEVIATVAPFYRVKMGGGAVRWCSVFGASGALCGTSQRSNARPSMYASASSGERPRE